MNLTGILPVLPTPFFVDGGIDPAAMRSIVRYALDAGVDGVVFPGFASEVETLTADERAELLEIVVQEAGGECPVVAGASAAEVNAVVAHGQQAQQLGIRHLMIQPPRSIGAGAVPVGDFIEAVSRALPGMEIILQNAPAPRGSDLSPAAIVEILKRIPAVTYVKEETLPAGPAITYILQNRPPSLKAVIGGGGARYILDEYARGATAAMPALEIAAQHVALDRAFRRKDTVTARQIYVDTLPLLVLQAVYRMRLTKHALMRQGVLDSGSIGVRATTPELDRDALADIDLCLEEALASTHKSRLLQRALP
ncbi:dihydrodipicolinate synthase family protein [Limoniibacter endophyticus]|uniref:Dihydrodipicolinate synthase family protein n=1 Tax=Limoniibacter endophyticus TaxID=1565040 RepID=A0A8J3DU08_9HYPH|nr:dihydrodipicolinate synthase family protein [Limoniibacter endophyticus]GHC76522.1 dihydrodipicolinate synthase family protein [Limoniibacter endophyticus]